MGLGLLQPPDDAGFVQVVRRHLHFDAVANGEADPAFAHFAADRGEDEVLVVELDAEHGSGENGVDDSFDFDGRFFHEVVLGVGDSRREQRLTDQPEGEVGAELNRREQRQQRNVLCHRSWLVSRFAWVNNGPGDRLRTHHRRSRDRDRRGALHVRGRG